MLPRIALLLVVAIIIFELFRVKKRKGLTFIELGAGLLNFFNMPYSTLLNLSFFFCLVSIQMTMWFYYATGKYINFYQLIFALWYFIFLAVGIKHYKIEPYDKKIFRFLLYAMVVPVALSGLNVTAVLVGIKATIIPFLLFFFLKIVLDSRHKIYNFFRVVVYGGIAASVYVVIEVFNRATALWPPLWEAPVIFTQKFRPHLRFYARDLAELVTVYIRPLGMYLDMHATSFLIMIGFFIVLILGDKLFKGRRTLLFLQALLFAGVLLSTVKTYIMMMIGLLFLISILKRKLNIGEIEAAEHMNRHLSFSYRLVGVTLVVFLVFFFAVFQHMILRLVGVGVGRATYIHYVEGLIHLITTGIPQQLLSHPINFFLGYGYGTKLSLAGEMHFLGRQLALIGWVGFFLYWAVFLRVARECLDGIKKLNLQSRDFTPYLFGLISCAAIAGSLIHYSPFNLSGHYIGALILLIGDQAFKSNRGGESLLYSVERGDG